MSSLIRHEDSMFPRFTIVHKNARSALDCGSEAAALICKREGGS
jgi:hypothetical protein